jgi:hypothetical protein
LHEEGNKYLPIRTTANNNATLISKTNNLDDKLNNSSNELNKFNNRFNAENIFNSPSSLGTTPKCNSTSRKISLKPLNTSRSGGGGQSPIESFNPNRSYNNNNNNFRRHASSISAHNSPSTNVYSPKNGYSSNSSKPPQPKTATLFDYLVTPIKSPNHNPADTPVIISDFKARFQQHQQQLVQQHQRQSSQTSLNNQTIDHEMSIAADNETESNETEVKKVHSDLGLSIKEKLNELDMEKMDILAKFYSQLILSIFFLTYID